MKGRTMDMTKGIIWKQLVLFAVPLLFGNLFQQLYNTVDSMVVGNFVGKEATILSVPFVPVMLRLISTPGPVIGHASIYLRIYFLGIIFLFTYNMGSSILRAVGDTKRPLCFLIASSLVNIALDILFVAGLQWGIAGAAFAP